MSLAAHMVLDAPLVAQNDLVGAVGLLVSRESVVANSEGGGVKALCGVAQEWGHSLDGTVYHPVKLYRT
jgi:hypothetical protein